MLALVLVLFAPQMFFTTKDRRKNQHKENTKECFAFKNSKLKVEGSRLMVEGSRLMVEG